MRPRWLDRVGCFPMLSLLFVLGGGVLYAAEPAQPIRLPSSVTPAAPPATELSADAIFVIECETPCLVLSSRVGFVSISEEAGPLRIRGRFVDATKIESRTYKAKQLWIVEALSPGEVELLIVPVGAKDEATIIRRTLVVGGAPRPPPIPEPTPPKPEPPVPTPQPPTPIPQPQPPAPETTLGLIAVVKESVAKNIPLSHRKVAQGLAEAYRHGAESLARGIWTPADAVKKQAELNRSIPGYSSEVWAPVFKDIANQLGQARDAGKLNTAKQWTAAFAELSVAFFQSYVGTVGE